ncbi:MAG TPA: polysaccharide ABC transporter ATP-binding protein [Bacteroidia bacterium]|nr:polysaccharide ABC transporter ATP-binding protein [Bacteroidia bacterium]HNU34771.1 polysaccharide ABC transporter ATP-binding protein [Bacteroidia bacterium]
MSIAISVQNVSKSYILQHKSNAVNSNFRETLVNNFKQVFSKKPAYNNTEEFWALRNISFDVNQGDRLGIIGRNGAGKSTLLKIISRIVEPASGKIFVKGRIASLLEVGTGFHPELTGRENIFLNGAILGMSRVEIKKNFDAIVDFSGVEKFLDTPVKRYSSGMYVRLAFAVAAHLQPEILIVDEVLAVGDAEFQKKCLGKMNEVSKSGRTILFVSHNMAAIQNLCNKSVLLNSGNLETYGSTAEVINRYISQKGNNDIKLSEIKERKGNGRLFFTKGSVVSIESVNENTAITFSDLHFDLEFETKDSHTILSSRIDIGINNFIGDRVAWLSTDTVGHQLDLSNGRVRFHVRKLPLAPGNYNCNLYCTINNEVADWITNVVEFSVIEKDYYNSGKSIPSNQGNILLDYSIEA